MAYDTIVASGIMGMVGTAVGAVMNHLLSKRSRRGERIADAKKEEYREMLTALNEAFMVQIQLRRHNTAIGPQEERELYAAESRSMRIMHDRIYIAATVAKLDLLKRWAKALSLFKESLDYFAFGKEVSRLSEEIRTAALADDH